MPSSTSFRELVFLIAVSALGAHGAAAQAPPPDQVAVTPLVTTLGGQPLGIANAGDDSNRLFIIGRTGGARAFENNALLATPFFTMTNASFQCAETVGGPLANTGLVTAGGEQGLLGITFHPQFETNGQFFISYSGAAGDSVVARITMADPDADVVSAADLQTCVVILRVDQDFDNHNGGNIMFGPDNFLYFGLGDGGSGNDPCNRGQTLDPSGLDNNGSCASDASFTDPDGNAVPDRPTTTRALQGKMLRLDIDGTTPAGANGLCGARLGGAANYAIPASNPFAGATPGCDEVFHYGLRNPWRWSFDRDTDELYLGDVGQDQWEEVDVLAAGAVGVNFDWKLCEGRHNRNSCGTLCNAPGTDTSEVIIAYPNTGGSCAPTLSNGCSVTGGFRYRGPDDFLKGLYFYGDACNAELRYAARDAGSGQWDQPTPAVIKTGINGTILGFGEDEGGALYFVAGSNLYRIGGPAPTGLLFRNGFEDPPPP